MGPVHTEDNLGQAQEQNKYFTSVFKKDEDVTEDIGGIPHSNDMITEIRTREVEVKKLKLLTNQGAWKISILGYSRNGTQNSDFFSTDHQ